MPHNRNLTWPEAFVLAAVLLATVALLWVPA